MVSHTCPHCKASHQAHGRRKKHQCKSCGGSFLSNAFNAVKKVASNPMVQQFARAAAPHAMNLLNKHAPGLANVANKAVGMYQQHAPMINKVLSSNPQQLLQQARANPGQFAQSAARALAPHAQNLAQRHAPGLVSSAQRAASSPLGQLGLSALRSQVGMGTHKGQKRKTARLAYEHDSSSDEEGGAKLHVSHAHQEKISQALAKKLVKMGPSAAEEYLASPQHRVGKHSAQRAAERAQEDALLHAAQVAATSPAAAKYLSASGRRRKVHRKYGRGGVGMLAAAQMAAPLISSIPGASEAISSVPGLGEALSMFGIGGPQQAPPPPPPRASFRAIDGFQAPGMIPRASVMGRGRRTRPPTAHSLAVKEVMKQTGMGLPAASKYVKEHGLAK